MIGLHFPNKIIQIGELFHPTGDNEADLISIKQYYQQFQGKFPDQF